MDARARTWIAKNQPLTNDETVNNAYLVYTRLKHEGWTLQCIAAVLANMEAESRINPGAWENYNYGNTSGGYGLVQWTPATKYINWAGEGWDTNHNKQLDRLLYESTMGGEFWVRRSPYSEWSFTDFVSSTEDVRTLACVFCWNFEGSAVVLWGTDAEKEALKKYRSDLADKWWSFIEENESNPTPIRRRKLPLWMYVKRKY